MLLANHPVESDGHVQLHRWSCQRLPLRSLRGAYKDVFCGRIMLSLSTSLQQYAIHRVGALMVEATAVSPEGRYSLDDNGIWSDEHIPGLKRIVDFAHSQQTIIGIQLWHVGRKV